MAEKLTSFLPPNRNIVIVDPCLEGDLLCLWSLNFDLDGMVQGYLDTGKIGCVLEPPRQTRLPMLTESLGCKFKPVELHNAGNGAHFTLRELLLLAVKNRDKCEVTSKERDTLAAIAKEEIPARVVLKLGQRFLEEEVKWRKPRPTEQEKIEK